MDAGGRWKVSQGAAFETEFAAFQGARHGVACTNGTAALEIALRALEIGCGHEAIVPPYTFIATASTVLQVGAMPVFVDIDPETLNIDPGQVEAAITPRTRAIIPVHIAGRPADMDALPEIARRRGLRLIEDAAQAHGAAWRGTRAWGRHRRSDTSSFQASKNLNAGEGGIVVSNDDSLAEAVWSVVNVGRIREGAWYEHHRLGSNFRLTEFQLGAPGAPSCSAFRTIWRAQRKRGDPDRAAQADPRHLLPREDARITTHAHHLFPFRYVASLEFGGKTLEELVKTLNAEGIPCSSGYVPLNRAPLFQWVSQHSGSLCKLSRQIDYPAAALPGCERVCSDCLWLPQASLLLGTRADMGDIATAVEKCSGLPCILSHGEVS